MNRKKRKMSSATHKSQSQTKEKSSAKNRDKVSTASKEKSRVDAAQCSVVFWFLLFAHSEICPALPKQP